MKNVMMMHLQFIFTPAVIAKFIQVQFRIKHTEKAF